MYVYCTVCNPYRPIIMCIYIYICTYHIGLYISSNLINYILCSYTKLYKQNLMITLIIPCNTNDTEGESVIFQLNSFNEIMYYYFYKTQIVKIRGENSPLPSPNDVPA